MNYWARLCKDEIQRKGATGKVKNLLTYAHHVMCWCSKPFRRRRCSLQPKHLQLRRRKIGDGVWGV